LRLSILQADFHSARSPASPFSSIRFSPIALSRRRFAFRRLMAAPVSAVAATVPPLHAFCCVRAASKASILLSMTAGEGERMKDE
jgi:hypothetical protein